MKSTSLLCLVAVMLATNVGHAALTTNSWTNSASSFWTNAASWTAGIPNANQAANLITNASSKTVTINSSTPTVALTISNLLVRGLGASTNTLQITNAPGSLFLVRNDLNVATNAVLLVTNSMLEVDGDIFGGFEIDGVVNFDSGTIIANTMSLNTSIGNVGRGVFTMKAGTMLSRRMIAGSTAGNPGTFTIAGGTNTIDQQLNIAFAANSTGMVWVTGGLLDVVNDRTDVGGVGAGALTISNGLYRTKAQNVGVQGRGTLTVAGGTTAMIGPLTVGGPGTGTVFITGGSLVVTNTPATVSGGSGFIVDGNVFLNQGQIIATNVFTVIGNRGFGSLTVSNGSFLAGNMTVGELGNHATGTLTFAGGTNRVTSILALGASTSTGIVWLTGGLLLTTNITTIVGEDTAGQMTVSNATWLARTVNIGSDVGSRGTLTIAAGTTIVSSNLTIGLLNCGSTGTVNITGGTL